MSTTDANRQIVRAAGIVMFAILFGQLTGLLRGILVAQAFGASPDLDAFFAANRVSETLFLLVAGGALGSAFIPTFTGLLAKDEKVSAWRLAFALANMVTLTLSLLAVLLAIFAPQVVRHVLAPGLSANSELFSLTIDLLRIQLISAVLFGLGGLLVGILNAHQVFLIPALTPAVYQLGIIFGTIVLAPFMGIYGLAWGVVIGAVLYLLIQVPSLIKVMNLLRPAGTSLESTKTTQDNYSTSQSWIWGRVEGGLGLRDANVRQVLLLMVPRLLGVAVVQLNFWVNTNLASNMEEGSVTGLYYGFSLMLMAQAAIAQSMSIAAMPTFSAQHALGKTEEMRASLVISLRRILMMVIPASIGLILLREPLISFLYQRGEFNEHDVQLVAWALLWYAAGLVGHSVMEVLTRAFYAQQDTKTPVFIGTIAMGLNVIFSFWFSAIFRQIGWFPLGGLALANSFATALEATALFIVMRKRLNGMEEKEITRGFLTYALAALGMAIGLLFWIQASARMMRWVVALGGVTLGGIIYGIVLVLMKVPEAQDILQFISRRMKGFYGT